MVKNGSCIHSYLFFAPRRTRNTQYCTCNQNKIQRPNRIFSPQKARYRYLDLWLHFNKEYVSQVNINRMPDTKSCNIFKFKYIDPITHGQQTEEIKKEGGN